MKANQGIYAVPIPIPPVGSYNLQFQARIASQSFTFLFKWIPNYLDTEIGGSWQIFVTMPDESVRIAGCVPGVVSWTAYPDYGLVVDSTMSSIGQNDLAAITLYWILWV